MQSETNVQSNAVRSLQTMLRTLSFYYPKLVRLIPNGFFDEKTADAVMAFQQEFGLPVTRSVDNDTWDAIVLAWTATEERMALPRETSNLPDWRYINVPGQRSVYLLLSQSIFKALSTVLEEIESASIDGINAPAHVRNIRWLQRRGGLRETGALGKEEWDLLTRLYSVFILRAPNVKAGR